jgi:ubiquinone/menaquinone biosynthesis C-methylase UbiE
MLMNRTEKAVVNSPVRAALLRRYELPLLERLGGPVAGLDVLEVGCGSGNGTRLLLEDAGAARVQAFDLDPDMVRRARRRLASRPAAGRLELSEGDVTAIRADDGAFDAVFDFGIIHHVPVWQDAISEIVRVLKPGGRFFFEEVTRHALQRWTYRILFEHPRENRFDGGQFTDELARQGLHLRHDLQHRFFGDFIFGVAYRQ